MQNRAFSENLIFGEVEAGGGVEYAEYNCKNDYRIMGRGQFRSLDQNSGGLTPWIMSAVELFPKLRWYRDIFRDVPRITLNGGELHVSPDSNSSPA